MTSRSRGTYSNRSAATKAISSEYVICGFFQIVTTSASTSIRETPSGPSFAIFSSCGRSAATRIKRGSWWLSARWRPPTWTGRRSCLCRWGDLFNQCCKNKVGHSSLLYQTRVSTLGLEMHRELTWLSKCAVVMSSGPCTVWLAWSVPPGGSWFIELMLHLSHVKQNFSCQWFFSTQGPPGTGKSTTIAASIAQIFANWRANNPPGTPKPRILLTASSNAAVDELVNDFSIFLIESVILPESSILKQNDAACPIVVISQSPFRSRFSWESVACSKGEIEWQEFSNIWQYFFAFYSNFWIHLPPLICFIKRCRIMRIDQLTFV